MPLPSPVCLAVAVAASLAIAQAQDAPAFLDVSLDSKPASVDSGAALVVTAKVGWRSGGSGENVWTRRGDAVEARLRYRAMWGEEKSAPMRPATGSSADVPDAPYATLAAAIPANELPKRGEMVRYWITVTERGGERASARKPKREGDVYGAVVDAAAIANESALPTLHWFVENAEGARWDDPVESFLAFDQSRGGGGGARELKFYGKGVTARRRGSGRRGDPNMWGKGGSKDWPKRKYKFDFRGNAFDIDWGDGTESAKAEEINAHSAYDEPGSESWLRETLAAAAMRRLGVPASAARHVVLRRNGVFHGLYVLVEQVDDAFLKRRGLDPTGTLYKAVHWKLSNLRPPAPEWAPCRYDRDWELAWGACPEVYRYSTPKKHATDARARDAEWHLGKLLDAIARVNGGGDAAALYAAVDVDAVAREMAAQTAMLHQDRCTKNYYVYRNPADGKWSRVPWDMEDAFATDYRSRDARCDANGATSCRADRGTYCVLSCEWWNSPFFCDAEHPQDIFTESDGRSTWNHLVNAVLKTPTSRAAYFRELRRTMATLHDDGWLEREARNLAAAVAPDAARDAEKWGLNEPGVGTEALLRQIHERRDTLTNEYGHLWRSA